LHKAEINQCPSEHTIEDSNSMWRDAKCIS